MKTALVTGAGGFIGRNLIDALRQQQSLVVVGVERSTTPAVLDEALASADVIFHLAGVNRPKDPQEFAVGNTGFTEKICRRLIEFDRRPLIVMSSSSQAALENPYGLSKLNAEKILQGWTERQGGHAISYRLKNVFGKWCRPDYNSVTATFCHNIAHDLPITITDSNRVLELIYIDDVVAAMVEAMNLPPALAYELREIKTSYLVTLGELAHKIQSFRDSRKTLLMPSFDDEFTRRLYATYLSYLEGNHFSYPLEQKTDARGCLAEFMKSAQFGQIFVSRTKPGVTRGNHYHHTKTEKFFVVEGEAVVRFRQIAGGSVIEHRVNGLEFKVVDIPPGYTHSIENVGSTELVTLFWASEIFDPQRPDVRMMPVLSDS
jgi:UDP-2-acetamido-2,6-beta-L-arabino-hexul-4-ose reductase